MLYLVQTPAINRCIVVVNIDSEHRGFRALQKIALPTKNIRWKYCNWYVVYHRGYKTFLRFYVYIMPLLTIYYILCKFIWVPITIYNRNKV